LVGVEGAKPLALLPYFLTPPPRYLQAVTMISTR